MKLLLLLPSLRSLVPLLATVAVTVATIGQAAGQMAGPRGMPQAMRPSTPNMMPFIPNANMGMMPLSGTAGMAPAMQGGRASPYGGGMPYMGSMNPGGYGGYQGSMSGYGYGGMGAPSGSEGYTT